MKKHRSRSGLVRGRVVDSRRPIALAECGGRSLVKGGVMPTKLFKVKTGSGRFWREFVRFCADTGLVFRVAGFKKPTDDGAQDRCPLGWYEVYGPEYGMRRLLGHPCVVTWQDCLDKGAPFFRSR